LVRAIILVKSPKKLIAARLLKISKITESFPVSGQFDAVAVISVEELNEIKDITTQIQQISGVERTETMVEVNN
jgi:DNA-binding Lrp family transcriptional regulator|tara:strand:+ start:575 stop:796 length:222 start_codon:yes stop_codon:yes gene_type:complete